MPGAKFGVRSRSIPRSTRSRAGFAPSGIGTPSRLDMPNWHEISTRGHASPPALTGSGHESIDNVSACLKVPKCCVRTPAETIVPVADTSPEPCGQPELKEDAWMFPSIALARRFRAIRAGSQTVLAIFIVIGWLGVCWWKHPPPDYLWTYD